MKELFIILLTAACALCACAAPYAPEASALPTAAPIASQGTSPTAESTPQPTVAEAEPVSDLTMVDDALSGSSPVLTLVSDGGKKPLSQEQLTSLRALMEGAEETDYPYIFAPAYVLSTSSGSVEIMPDAYFDLRSGKSVTVFRAGVESPFFKAGFSLFTGLTELTAPQEDIQARMRVLNVFAAAENEQNAADALLRDELLPALGLESYDTLSFIDAEPLSDMSIYPLAAFDFSATAQGARVTHRVICVMQQEPRGTRLYALCLCETGGTLKDQAASALADCALDIAAMG